MKKRRLRGALSLLLAGFVLSAFAALAAEVGSREDPLVTLSYLNGAYLNRILDEVDEKLEERSRALLAGLSGTASGGGTSAGYDFTPVTLSAGESLRGTPGCEILLRSGAAVCASPAGTQTLADTTSGSAVSGGGALAVNHLYLVLDTTSVQASGDALLLIRGDCYIE